MPRRYLYQLPDVLEAPQRPNNLSQKAQWLAGEGCGSWFELEETKPNQLIVKRFSRKGELECEKAYINLSGFAFTKDYSITYPSFCNKVTIFQNGKKITLLE
jgi:hypothetical protein